MRNSQRLDLLSWLLKVIRLRYSGLGLGTGSRTDHGITIIDHVTTVCRGKKNKTFTPSWHIIPAVLRKRCTFSLRSSQLHSFSSLGRGGVRNGRFRKVENLVAEDVSIFIGLSASSAGRDAFDVRRQRRMIRRRCSSDLVVMSRVE